MPFAIRDTVEVMHSHIARQGYITQHQVGEFTAPPVAELSAAVWPDSVGIPETTLNSLVEIHTLTVRIMIDWLKYKDADREYRIMDAQSRFLTDLVEDFQLGGNIRAIDFAGMYGSPVSIDWGRIDIGTPPKIYRVVDIRIPLIIDSSDTLAP